MNEVRPFKVTRFNPNSLFRFQIFLGSVKIEHTRISYTFLDILAHIGGLSKAFTVVFGIFFVLYSENLMIMELASYLFVLKRDEANIFDNSTDKEIDID